MEEEEHLKTTVKEEVPSVDDIVKMEVNDEEVNEKIGLFSDPLSNDLSVRQRENLEPSSVDSSKTDKTLLQPGLVSRPVPKTYANKRRNQAVETSTSNKSKDFSIGKRESEVNSNPGKSAVISKEFSQDFVSAIIKAEVLEDPDFCAEPGSSDAERDLRCMDSEDIAHDELLYCLECLCAFTGDCPRHGPLLIIPDTPILDKEADEFRAMKTAPLQVTITDSKIPNAGRGVIARDIIPDRSRFGPYEGQKVPRNEGSEYAWLIREDGYSDHCIDARDPSVSNWMRFVNCARNEVERNLFAFQYQQNIYFRTIRVIHPGEELLVWCGNNYAQKLGIDPTVMDAGRFKSPIRAEDSTESAETPDLPVEWSLNVCTESADKLFTCTDCHKRFSRKRTLDNHILTHNKDRPFVCPDCNERFAQKYTLDHHKRTHIGRNPFVCSECNECFSERASLLLHLKAHSAEKPFVCPECDKCFRLEKHLDTHMLMHNREKPFVCPECDEGFWRKDGLLVHLRSHTGEKPYVCPVCDKRFSQQGHLNAHLTVHSGQKLFVCPECDERFSRQTSLDSHLRLHTGEKPFLCPDCGERFSRKATMENHLRVHSGEKPFACPQCDKRFTQKANLDRHFLTHLKGKTFVCTQCNESFPREDSLLHHVQIYHSENRFVCTECDTAFPAKAALDIHVLTHSEEKSEGSGKRNLDVKSYTGEERSGIVCSECNERFSRKDALSVHMRIHTGEKPFECTHCDKRFTQKTHLHRHVLVHTGEKPFVCADCGENFARKDKLVVHQLNHTGLFRCRFCNQEFSEKAVLERHVKVHSNRKQFECPDCQKKFHDKSKFTTHLRTHTKERPFQCSDCEAAFTQKGHLKRHLTIHSR